MARVPSGRLEAAVKCDELAHEAKDLRMEMEDVGTTGDGENTFCG